jgi:hypothetical protein
VLARRLTDGPLALAVMAYVLRRDAARCDVELPGSE